MGLRRRALVGLCVIAVCAGGAPPAGAAAWTAESSPNPRGALSSKLFDVSCPTRRMCMAVGSWTNEPYGGYDTSPLTEQWKGRRWSIRAAPNPVRTGPTVLRSVSCPSADVCIAVGSSGDGRALVERWNRGRWRVQRLSWLAADLLGVSCPSIRVCVAVGATSSGGDNAVIERWNGRVWSLQQTPTPLALRHRGGDEAFVGGLVCVGEILHRSRERRCKVRDSTCRALGRFPVVA